MLGTAVLCRAAWAHAASPPAAAISLGSADDRFIVRLTPAASRAAFVPLGAGPVARARLGVPSLDRVLAGWPGAWLEPEFRGDRPPAPGSPETDFSAFYVVHVPPGARRDDALRQFRATAEVTEAHEIGFAPVAAVPNDSLWSLAYYFYQPSRRDIHAPEAWDLTKGDTSIVVAILDSGVVPYHPDLGGTVAGSSGQFWTNWAEQNGVPGVDDDHNGFVDDVHGWDFVSLINSFDAVPGEDWQDEDGDPNDFIGHGTGVAGLIGAINDNVIGVTGTAWNVRLMPLRVVWASPRQQTGIVDMSYVTAAIRYATRMRADVINISLSNTSVSELDLAVKAALDSGIVIVVAAGNNGTPNYIGDGHPDVVVVAATDADDVVPVWSNRNSHVDLAAPGLGMATTIRARAGTDSLGLRSPGYVPDEAGTSFATPLVSGAVALMEAVRKARGIERLTPRQVGTVLRYTADDIASQNPGITDYGTGRLNMARAVTAAARVRSKRLRARIVSPGVTFQTNRGDSVLALPTEDGQLEFYDAIDLGLVGSLPLGSTPAAPLSAADLGLGRGLGIFVPLGDHIAAFGAAGATLPGWPVRLLSGGLVGNLALGDLDGDGSLEVVGVGTGGKLWVWTATGSLFPRFPLALGPAADVYTPLALSDIDGQPGAEIIVAQTNGTVHAFRLDGSEVPGWPVATNDALPAGPVVGALASQPLVVVAGSRAVHRILPDGTALPEIARIAVEVATDPGLGDLDHDGADDVVIAGSSGAQAIGLAGSVPNGWPVLWSSPVVGSPLIGYLATTDTQAVIVPVGPRFRGLSGAGGALPDFLPYPDGDAYSSLMATGSGDSIGLIQGSSADSTMYRYEARSGRPGSPSAWPTVRGGFARTGSRSYTPPMGVGDAIPPSTILDLAASALPDSTTNLLRWTAPSDAGPAGKAAEYEVRAAANLLTLNVNFASARRLAAQLVPGAAGARDSLLVSGLGDSDRWFGIRSRDASGNWSTVSPPAARKYPPSTAPGPPTTLELVLGRNPSSLPLAITWQATGSVGDRTLRIYDLVGRLVRSIRLGTGSEGTLSWDGSDESAAIVPSGVYVATLVSGQNRVTRRFVLLR